MSRAAALGLGWLAASAHRGNVFFDITFYQSWSEGVLSGQRVPYRDFAWEYPPGALPAMTGPGLVASALGATVASGVSDAHVFGGVWLVFMLAVDAVVMRGLLRVSPLASRLWLVGLPLLGAVSWSRYDLLPAAMAVAAVLAAASGRTGRSGLLAAAGGALKIWPLLLAPIQRTRAGAARAVLSAAATLGLVAGITFGATGKNGFGQVVDYQTSRGLQVESLPALPFLWLRHLHSGSYDVAFRYGAYEFTGPGTHLVAQATSVVYALGLLLLGVAHWMAMRRGLGPQVVTTSAAAFMLLTLTTNKVFSPQYMLWLLAVVGAACVVDPTTWAPLIRWVLAAVALTAFVFPWHYSDVLDTSHWLGVGALTARDVIVLWLAVTVGCCVAGQLRSGRDRAGST